MPHRVDAMKEPPLPRPTTLTAFVTALAAAVSLAACGSSDTPGIPSARTSTPGGTTTASSTPALAGEKGEIAAYAAAQRAWVGCMRTHGVDLPDPDQYGQVTIKSKGSGTTWHDAYAACASLLVARPAAVDKLTKPPVTDAERATRRAYATCMQTHGAPDFPDVGSDGYFVDRQWNQTAPGAQTATRACAHIIGDPASPGPGVG